MSLDSREFALQLEHHWGGITASHVFFDNHSGPFEAVVETSAGGVRITFNGWEEHPFVATAAGIRIVYHRAGARRVDVLTEAIPGSEVRISPVARPPIKGRKVAIRFGGPDVRYVPLDDK
jgi:hypothetical protein